MISLTPLDLVVVACIAAFMSILTIRLTIHVYAVCFLEMVNKWEKEEQEKNGIL